MGYFIYNKKGEPRVEVGEFEYSDTYKGSCQITLTISSPTPINFEVGDYIVFRDERFTLGYIPPRKKQASSKSYGEAFVYENVIFNSYSDELTRCMFLDIVLEDNKEHYTSLPNVSFYASSIKDVADRLQANLDRFYGKNVWRILVASGTTSKDSAFSFQSAKCWDVLVEACNKLELNFIRKGRVITIGSQGSAISQTFQYGKDNGLKSISISSNEEEAVITRLRAYGSTRNMPYRYYNHLWKSGNKVVYDKTDKLGESGWERVISEAMYVPNLMLPGFRNGDMDAHIDSANQSVYGLTEGSVFFDSEDESSETAEVYPTIEGMTATELRDLGYSINIDANDNGNLDEVASAEQMTDIGLLPEDGSELQPSKFSITIKDIGFDINDYLSDESAQITMRSGACIGRTFPINSVERSGNKYVLNCTRYNDTDVEVAYPNKNFQVSSGDKFSILGIYMPDVYVQVAETRLQKAAEVYLSDHDHASLTYKPVIDDIFMARHPDLGKSIRAGDLFNFVDDDFGLDVQVAVSALTIKIGKSMIPQYDVTLSDETEAELVNRVANEVAKMINTQGTGVDTRKVVELIRQQGRSLFLSKTEDDTAQGAITIAKSLNLGDTPSSLNADGTARIDRLSVGYFESMLSGGFLGMDNDKSYLEVDNMYVRAKAYFDTLEINRTTYNCGRRIAGAAGIIVKKVVELADRWRCYYLAEQDGAVAQDGFASGDLCFCEDFRFDETLGRNVSNHRYWCLYLGKADETDANGYRWIDLSKADRENAKNTELPIVTWNETTDYFWGETTDLEWQHDYGTGWLIPSGDAPMAGDHIVQFGNKSNATRQGAIMEQAAGVLNVPSYIVLQGIKDYDISETNEVIWIGYDTGQNRAKMKVFGDFHFGGRTNTEPHISFNSASGDLDMVLSQLQFVTPSGEVVALLGDDEKINNQLINLAPLTLQSANIPTLGEIYLLNNNPYAKIAQYDDAVELILPMTYLGKTEAEISLPTKDDGSVDYRGVIVYSGGANTYTEGVNVSNLCAYAYILVNDEEFKVEATQLEAIKDKDGFFNFQVLLADFEQYAVDKITLVVQAGFAYVGSGAVSPKGYTHLYGANYSYWLFHNTAGYAAQNKTIVGGNGFVSYGQDTALHVQTTDVVYNEELFEAGITLRVEFNALKITKNGIYRSKDGGTTWILI